MNTKKKIAFMTISQTVKSLGCFVHFMFIKMNHALLQKVANTLFCFLCLAFPCKMNYLCYIVHLCIYPT